MTRVGIPSVWESTACRTRRLRTVRPARLERRLGGAPDGELLLRRERLRAAAGTGRRDRPTMSIDSLIACTNSVLESQRSSGWRVR